MSKHAKSKSVPKIQELHHDLLFLIFTHLSTTDFHSFICTNKSIYRYCIGDQVYYELAFKKKVIYRECFESLKDVSNNYRKELVKFGKSDFSYGFYSKQEIMNLDMDMEQFANQRPINLVMIGKRRVGRNAFVRRVVYPKWFDSRPFVFSCKLELNGKFPALLRVSDILEQYEHIRAQLDYPGTDIFLIGYSVSDRESFSIIPRKIFPELKCYRPNAICALVGCKIDERNNEQTIEMPITFEEGLKMAQDLKCATFLESSAKTGEGFEEIGEILTRLHCIRLSKLQMMENYKHKKCILQ